MLSQIEAPEDAARVAGKLIEAVSQPYTIELHELILTASIGISIYPDHGKEASSLLRNADASMYSAKEAGRNQYRFYSEESTSRATERLSLERDLRRAVEQNEIYSVYQPQIELAYQSCYRRGRVYALAASEPGIGFSRYFHSSGRGHRIDSAPWGTCTAGILHAGPPVG